MAANKVTRSRKRGIGPSFSEVKGKIIDSIEIHSEDFGIAIGIMFKDRTYLCFDVEPFITVTPDLSDWKTQNYRPIKHWRSVRS